MLTLAKPGKIWLALTLSLLAAAVTHSAESAALCCSLGVQISKKRGFPALQCGDSSGHWHQAVFGASLERLVLPPCRQSRRSRCRHRKGPVTKRRCVCNEAVRNTLCAASNMLCLPAVVTLLSKLPLTCLRNGSAQLTFCSFHICICRPAQRCSHICSVHCKASILRNLAFVLAGNARERETMVG